MKISKLFHWLYAFLMIFPLLGLAFNFVRISFSGDFTVVRFEDVIYLIKTPEYIGLGYQISNIYGYLLHDVFGTGSGAFLQPIIGLLTYWTITSIVYLIFDVLMYVPLLVHRWLDKARLE